jgi:hypothetical protein
MARQLEKVLAAVAPSKASVEFSVDLTVEAGKLVALFFESGGTAGLKVCLEWERRAPTGPASAGART